MFVFKSKCAAVSQPCFLSLLSTTNYALSTTHCLSLPQFLLQSCSGQTMTRPRKPVNPFSPDLAQLVPLALGANQESSAARGSGQAR